MKEINKIKQELNERIAALIKERDALLKEYLILVKKWFSRHIRDNRKSTADS